MVRQFKESEKNLKIEGVVCLSAGENFGLERSHDESFSFGLHFETIEILFCISSSQKDDHPSPQLVTQEMKNMPSGPRSEPGTE